jgi:alpha-L-fucosidase
VLTLKFGIFIHWGVYSVPSYGTEWYWHNVQCGNKKDKAFQDRVYGPDYKYKQFVPQFKAELYDADAWVKTIKGSGAQYVLPVAKHHDGFTMWESKQSPGWNAVEVGPKRDVLTELYNASVKADLPFGIYYSQGEWFDADMVNDHKNNFTTNAFITKKVIPQRLDLVTRYPKVLTHLLMHLLMHPLTHPLILS